MPVAAALNTRPARPAFPGEARALSALAAATFREAFGEVLPGPVLDRLVAERFAEARIASELLDPACRTFVCDGAGELEGYAVARPSPSPIDPPGADWELSRIYVRQRSHGLGAGESLMAACVAAARSAGARGLWLRVWEGNGRGRSFYRRWGFLPAGREVIEVSGQPLVHLILENRW